MPPPEAGGILILDRGDGCWFVFPRMARHFQKQDCVSICLDRTLFDGNSQTCQKDWHDYLEGRRGRDERISRPSRPSGIDPIGASTRGRRRVYELIRDDIIEGRLKANERLVVSRPCPAAWHVDQPSPRGAAAAQGRRLRHLRPQSRRARAADRPGFRPRHLRDRRPDRAGADPLVRRHGDRTRTSPNSSAFKA